VAGAPLRGGGFSTLPSYLILIAVLLVRAYGMVGAPDIARVQRATDSP
jgi:hypothetical protein